MTGRGNRQTAVIAVLLLCLVSTGMGAGYRTLTELKQTALAPEVENALAEFVGSERSGPISLRVPPRPDLGDDR